MSVRGILISLAGFCLLLQWIGLRSTLTYGGYHDLGEDVAEGRMELEDASRIGSLLQSEPSIAERLDPEMLRTRTMLHVYNMDLAAIAKGHPPLQPSRDVEITEARSATFRALKFALEKAPHDGELWMRMAFAATALELPQSEITRYIALSEQTAPHEGWIKNRRDMLSSSSN